MRIAVLLSAMAVAAGSVTAKSEWFFKDRNNWSFSTVKSIKARVQGDLPVWDAEHQVFVSGYYDGFEAQYNGVLDTVNMASVEGAFKYVQAECINYYDIQDLDCQRKNNIKYVVLYETEIAQPRAAMARYQLGLDNAAIEHCPFIPMDGGQCTPTNGVLPELCDLYLGLNNAMKMGFCIGGELRDTEYLAPYPNTYWFAFPNSCPTQVWANKTDECRKKEAGGLCPFGTKPDGVKCQFSYKILGWVALDDVVGITSMVNEATGQPYANYTEFCEAGGIEYKVNTDNGKLTVEETIPFWADPANPTANSARADQIVAVYHEKLRKNATTADGGVMQELPSVAELTRDNPPCFKNNLRCATSFWGCRRTLYAQICEVCDSYHPDCEIAPLFYHFPQL